MWTEVLFTTAVAVRITPDGSAVEDLLGAYSRISEIGESAWLRDILDADRDTRLPEGIKHFAIYFDHFGAVEVAAVGFKIIERISHSVIY